jgi:hypothetical protein
MTVIKLKRATRPFSIALPTDRYLWHLFGSKDRYKLDTFLSGGLYLARLDRFHDSREGTLPRRNRNLLTKAPAFEQTYIRDAYRQAVRQSFATCWHRSSGEPSDYVWKEFGGNHDGIAIRTSPQRMAKALRPIAGLGAAHLGVIRYIDHAGDLIGTQNILQSQFVVRSKYRREGEARLLLHTYGPFGSKLIGLSGPKGVLVRIRKTKTIPQRHEFVGGYGRGTAIVLAIEPKEFIEEIVLGRRIGDSLCGNISRRVAALTIPCRRVIS